MRHPTLSEDRDGENRVLPTERSALPGERRVLPAKRSALPEERRVLPAESNWEREEGTPRQKQSNQDCAGQQGSPILSVVSSQCLLILLTLSPIATLWHLQTNHFSSLTSPSSLSPFFLSPNFTLPSCCSRVSLVIHLSTPHKAVGCVSFF